MLVSSGTTLSMVDDTPPHTGSSISFKRTKQWKQGDSLSNFKFMLTVEQCPGVKRKADGYTQHPFAIFAEGKQFIPEDTSKLYDILKITYIKGERRL